MISSMNEGPRIRPLKRSTLGDEVYAALQTLIMKHTLAPGDRLNIDALARQLAVSPTPVRESLARLESDGLVRKRPLAGYTVSPLLTREEFTDMFDMRMLLEPATARWAADRADSDLRARISAEAAAAVLPVDGDHAQFTAMDARFHDLIAAAAGNQLLRDSVGRLHAHLHLHRLYLPYAQAGTTQAEHRRLADAIVAGDAAEAEEAMRAHLTSARERHLQAFDQRVAATGGK
jgi:DNA-binding GntR family transcriptional regulator